MVDSVVFEFAVYQLPGATKDPLVALHQTLAKKYPTLKLVKDLPKQPQTPVLAARLQEKVHAEYTPPNLKALKYFGEGLNREQAQALQEAKEALILDFAHPKGSAWAALKTANELVEQVARKTEGLIWDEETRQVFTPDAWHKKRLASWAGDLPDISTQTAIHLYDKDEYARAISLGMVKMGLPDVVVEEVPWSSGDQVGNLINIFCQSMVEGGSFEKPGIFKLDLRSIKNAKVRGANLKPNGTGVACVSLKNGKWEEGDPKNRLIELGADKYPGPDVHSRQDQLLDSFFGWQDAITYVRHDNEEVLAASFRAKAKLPELQKAFSKGFQPGEFIQVKAPFETPDGGTEWMWVEITSWKETKIKGLLENEPFNVPNLHSGQVVEVRQEDVFDYIRTYPDKHTEGNTTGEIIKKLDEGRVRKSPDQPATKTSVPDCES